MEFGKCESCGATEQENCQCRCRYLQLPVPVYDPAHLHKLQQMLLSLCLNCLKMKPKEGPSGGLADRSLGVCCEEAAGISIRYEISEGASYLELVCQSRQEDRWNFLERYGYLYGSNDTRRLLPTELKEILTRIPEETREKLKERKHNPEEEYIIEYLRVPMADTGSVPLPSCVSVADAFHGYINLSDPSRIELKDVLEKVVAIRSSTTRFEWHETEANDLARVVNTYLQVRGRVLPTSRERVLPTSRTSIFHASFTTLGQLVNFGENATFHNETELHKLFVEGEESEQYVVLKSGNSKSVLRQTLLSDHISEEYNNHEKASQDAAHVLQLKNKFQDLKFDYMEFEFSCCSLEDIVEFMRTNTLKDDNNETSWIHRAPWGEMGTISSLKLKLITGIVNGVEAIHRKGIIHRRLTPESVKIVYREPYEVIVKISDFRSSKMICGNKFLPSEDEKSTSRWLSPEQIRGEEESYPVDMFAVGCLIHYVLYGSHPFGDDGDIVRNIRRKTVKYKTKSSIEINFFNKFLADNPEIRIRPEKVKNHPCFWVRSRKMAFLQAVHEKIRTSKNFKGLVTHMKASRNDFIGEQKNWMKRLDSVYEDFLRDKYMYTEDCPVDMLAAIRNSYVHYGQLPPVFKMNKLKSNRDGLLDYFDGIFPSFFIEIYEYIYKYKRAEEGLTTYF